jgi:hypothetical protein
MLRALALVAIGVVIGTVIGVPIARSQGMLRVDFLAEAKLPKTINTDVRVYCDRARGNLLYIVPQREIAEYAVAVVPNGCEKQ